MIVHYQPDAEPTESNGSFKIDFNRFWIRFHISTFKQLIHNRGEHRRFPNDISDLRISPNFVFCIFIHLEIPNKSEFMG